MKGGLGQLMKQAQKLQEDFQQAQNELASMEVVGEAGAGMVTVTMTGRHDVRSVRIDQVLMGEDKEMLEDLIAAALNDAVHKVEARTKDRFAGLGSALNLPPGMKLPF
ncbi:MAG: YbaB/EbfC family nucleoid-associated protein [Thiotrichales bacterium]|nr:YbaB/EbfC family nucleoid-associated protein [Thiotrichales bacterium]